MNPSFPPPFSSSNHQKIKKGKCKWKEAQGAIEELRGDFHADSTDYANSYIPKKKLHQKVPSE